MLNLQTTDRYRQVDTSQASLHAYLAPLVAKSHYRKIALSTLYSHLKVKIQDKPCLYDDDSLSLYIIHVKYFPYIKYKQNAMIWVEIPCTKIITLRSEDKTAEMSTSFRPNDMIKTAP